MEVFDIEPYKSQISITLNKTLQHCCSKKINKTIEIKEKNISELVMGTAHFIYPVLASTEPFTVVYGHSFIPLLDPPGAFYIAKKQRIQLSRLVQNCFQLWPLLLLTIFMSAISGFLVWVFETRDNAEEFPRPFLRGWLEGIWWSFISMTTVGYGDKAPKRFLGRLFAVFWILIGITITSMYIGGLAGAIYGLQEPPGLPTLNGRLVGGLKHQLQDATVVAQHGAILHDIEVEDEVFGSDGIVETVESWKDRRNCDQQNDLPNLLPQRQRQSEVRQSSKKC